MFSSDSNLLYISGAGNPYGLSDWAWNFYEFTYYTLICLFLVGIVVFFIRIFYEELGPRIFFGLIAFFLIVGTLFFWPLIMWFI